MAAEITPQIIDEPMEAGLDLAASQQWLNELLEMDQENPQVQAAVARARTMVAQAQELHDLLNVT